MTDRVPTGRSFRGSTLLFGILRGSLYGIVGYVFVGFAAIVATVVAAFASPVHEDLGPFEYGLRFGLKTLVVGGCAVELGLLLTGVVLLSKRKPDTAAGILAASLITAIAAIAIAARVWRLTWQ